MARASSLAFATAALALVLVAGSRQSTSPNDWLLGAVPHRAEVVEGQLEGVPTLTLQNGLVARTFALLPPNHAPPTPPHPPPPPTPPPAPCPASCTGCGCSPTGPCGPCCANPGGRIVHGPDPAEVYPYYGKPCGQQSDCGQCTLDHACTCLPVTAAPDSPKCCKKGAPPPPAPPAGSNRTAFATVALSRAGYAGREHDTGAQLLRTSSPEAQIVLDGLAYDVGGLSGQTEFAFLNMSLLAGFEAAPGAFHYTGHRVGMPQTRYAWTPGERFSDPTLSWPPKGTTLEIDFGAPSSAPAAHQGVVVTVVYAMYDGLPLYAKWAVVSNDGAHGNGTVVVDALTTELLYVTTEAMGYWARTNYGSLTSTATSGRIHMESEMSRGAGTTSIGSDARCSTCVQGSPSNPVLNSSYGVGPGAEIGDGGFHGENFTSFHTYVLLHDTDDTERQGLGVRKMYRTLAPQITENPIFMHLTDTTPAGIKKAVDQCAVVGFEMIILSFGSGLNMESKDPAYIRSVAASVAYAHSKNISIGGYNLMSSSRTVAPGGNCVDPAGKPAGASCLASDWSDDYFSTIKNFIVQTGFDMIETDGPYEGASCYSKTHSHHRGHADSEWTQYERNMEFYAWCRERGMYIHAPDPFYMRGINQDGMGYVETNWNLPLWEQINLARQNIYDGTWSKIPSQGWMFVPLVQYHGGWPECCIEPAGFLAGQWEYYLAMYFGTGVSPCYRGTRLYSELVPASKALVQKYTAWNARYRVILHADMIHLKRPDGNGIDAMLHVEPDATKSKERAMLIVFNQNPSLHVNTTLRVPMYYSGLDTTTSVSLGGAPAQNMTLARDWSVQLPVVMAPNSIAWYSFE